MSRSRVRSPSSWRERAALLALLAACADGRAAAVRAGDAGADALEDGCLPACILALYDGCRAVGPCTVEASGGVSTLCYRNGVRVVRRQLDVTRVSWTNYAASGAPCAQRVVDGSDFEYRNLIDGRTARMRIVSKDLRTAFCGPDGSDLYSDVYPLPKCLALEAVRCEPGDCAAPAAPDPPPPPPDLTGAAGAPSSPRSP